jgi:cyclic lactone autoinducer peptide
VQKGGGVQVKKLLLKVSSILPALALVAAVASAKATCWFFYHQPDIPDALKKYDK